MSSKRIGSATNMSAKVALVLMRDGNLHYLIVERRVRDVLDDAIDFLGGCRAPGSNDFFDETMNTVTFLGTLGMGHAKN
jgi:hypothetical protein